MMKRREGGSIVNIQSINALCGAPHLAIYSASKGALSVLTKNTANAYLADRIRANGINMGWTLTPGEEVMQGETLGKGGGWAEERSHGKGGLDTAAIGCGASALLRELIL